MAVGPLDPARSSGRPAVGLLLTLLIAAPLIALAVWPQWFGVERLTPLAQLISFRAPLAIGLAVLAAVSAAVAVRGRRWGIAAALAIVLTIGAAANTAVLMDRGATAVLGEGELTVVVWNTQGGATSPEDVARLVAERHADIVSLPETDERAAAQIVRLLEAEGVRMTPTTIRSYDEAYSWIPTTLLISERLGEYRHDANAGSTPGLPSGVWIPVDGDGPRIVAAHPLPPLPATRSQWEDGLRWLADACDGADTIVAGDLNATIDHLSGLGVDGGLLGRCDDAALSVGAGALGTWPSDMPSWLAAPIDHVLIGTAWVARGAGVIDVASGSDHRPFIAVLDRRTTLPTP